MKMGSSVLCHIVRYIRIKDKGENFEQEFLADLKQWIKIYKNLPFTKVNIEDTSRYTS